jgi:hypothetical protein
MMTKTENYWLVDSKNFDATTALGDVTDALVELHAETTDAELNAILEAFTNVVFFGNTDFDNDSITIVPSKNEAEDYLYMLKIEQDLGDFE